MFFKPYANGQAGVICRDGGLKQNNRVETAYSEAKAIWGNDSTFDMILSVGTGQARLAPVRPASAGITKGWLVSLFDHFMTTFNKEVAWSSFYKLVPELVKAQARRLNLRFDTIHEPALDNVNIIAALKVKAKEFSFYNEKSR
jgi:hypothetical protein